MFTGTRIATPRFYIMSDTPVFTGTGRWLTHIVPLSTTAFIKMRISGGGYTQPLDNLIQTIEKI